MIPLFSPLRQNESLMPDLEARLLGVLRSGEYILGKEVDTFEKALSEKLGYAHAIGCASGTEALVLAMKACGLEAGDEVITPAFSFVASASAVHWAGYRPVFADVSLDTQNVTVETVERALTRRTRAVIAVDLYGRQAPIRELRRWCDAQGLYLIEDGAQSIGVPENGAHVYTTSFYPTKNVGAIGDGGAVLTQDGEIAGTVRELSRHGGLDRDHYMRVGTTGRLDTLQAAVLNVKLPHLSGWSGMRRSLVDRYQKYLQRFVEEKKLVLPPQPRDPQSHVWALFTVRVLGGARGGLAERLRDKGVGCGIYYPKAIPAQPAMKAYATGRYPDSEQLVSEVLSLPLFPELDGKEFDAILKALSECL